MIQIHEHVLVFHSGFLFVNNIHEFFWLRYCDYAGYESVFDKKAFGSELEVIELESFFKECDMYPSASEIDEAIDVVFHGKNIRILIIWARVALL